jgi:uncharacterized protein (DUF302 family)
LKCRCSIGSIAVAHYASIEQRYRTQSSQAFQNERGRGDPVDRRNNRAQEAPMSRRIIQRAACLYTSLRLLFLLLAATSSAARASEEGIVRVKSAVPMAEAITRIKADIASKGIKFFSEIDQSELAAGAGIKLRPSTLLVFGNPPLGTQFITSNANAGLDWPVRLLLTQDDNGDVWAVWTDLNGLQSVITSRIAQRSSRWQPWWSIRSPRPLPANNVIATGAASSRERAYRSKIIVDRRTDRILGAHLVGHEGQELINAFGLAIRFGITARQLKEHIYAYPTFSADIKHMLPHA